MKYNLIKCSSAEEQTNCATFSYTFSGQSRFSQKIIFYPFFCNIYILWHFRHQSVMQNLLRKVLVQCRGLPENLQWDMVAIRLHFYANCERIRQRCLFYGQGKMKTVKKILRYSLKSKLYLHLTFGNFIMLCPIFCKDFKILFSFPKLKIFIDIDTYFPFCFSDYIFLLLL